VHHRPKQGVNETGSRPQRHSYPEVSIDLNGRKSDLGWSLNGLGSIGDLAKLGLSLEAAVGKRFIFFSPDLDDAGRPDDIMFSGVVIYDDTYGYVASQDSDGFYWRSELADHDP
jgi:hypothetical protein